MAERQADNAQSIASPSDRRIVMNEEAVLHFFQNKIIHRKYHVQLLTVVATAVLQSLLSSIAAHDAFDEQLCVILSLQLY